MYGGIRMHQRTVHITNSCRTEKVKEATKAIQKGNDHLPAS